MQFSGAADGRAYFGFGASSAGTLSLVAAPNTNQLLIQNNSGWGYTNIGAVNQTWQANHWYRLEVDWGTSGKIVGKLFDSNGTTLLQTVTASTSVITAGGIAFRATGNYNKFWDTVTVTPGVNQFVQPAAAALPAIAQDAAWRDTVAGLPGGDPRAGVQAHLPDSERYALEAWFAAFGAGSPATTSTSPHHSDLWLDGIVAQLQLSGRVVGDL